ncbi:hypothetical protein ACTOB_003904 [Actinoplanes oblitus]|uniref:DUF4198 domain-containing protein n=1 Tax=Actinoplanes oblitus TaxID=3040509 RepID=A0ABY8WQR9_9ACTN|nr:hypothetical protein [Actinoplanes oblitus]WIN00210.1 hypothetical protein ACTOB_003904 [Actinoplanes oblitus]
MIEYPIAIASTNEWDRNKDMRVRFICHAALAAVTVAVLNVNPQVRVRAPLSLSSVVVPSVTLQASESVPIAGKPGKRRHRPSWIWRFFGATLPAVTCYDKLRAGGSKPTVVLDRLLDPLLLCFEGFTPKDKPVMRIIAPDGTATEWPAVRHSGDFWAWTWNGGEEVLGALPHPGTYRFEVTAAETPTTFGVIEAKSASAPQVYFSDVDVIHPGETVSAMVVGRQPESAIFASLYGKERSKRLQVVHDFPPAIADQWGEGVIRWTVTDEPDGAYGFLVETPDNDRHDACLQLIACTMFRVRR